MEGWERGSEGEREEGGGAKEGNNEGPISFCSLIHTEKPTEPQESFNRCQSIK